MNDFNLISGAISASRSDMNSIKETSYKDELKSVQRSSVKDLAGFFGELVQEHQKKQTTHKIKIGNANSKQPSPESNQLKPPYSAKKNVVHSDPSTVQKMESNNTKPTPPPMAKMAPPPPPPPMAKMAPPPPPPPMTAAASPQITQSSTTSTTGEKSGGSLQEQLAAKIAAKAAKASESKASEGSNQTAKENESNMTSFETACRELADTFGFTLDAVQYMSTLATKTDLKDPSDIQQFQKKFNSDNDFRQNITDKAVLNILVAPFYASHKEQVTQFNQQIESKLKNGVKLDLIQEFSKFRNELTIDNAVLGNTVRSHYMSSDESTLNSLVKANNKLLMKKYPQKSNELQVKLSDISNARLNEPKTYLSLLQGGLTSKESPRDKAENLIDQLTSTVVELDDKDKGIVKARLAALLAQMS